MRGGRGGPGGPPPREYGYYRGPPVEPRFYNDRRYDDRPPMGGRSYFNDGHEEMRIENRGGMRGARGSRGMPRGGFQRGGGDMGDKPQMQRDGPRGPPRDEDEPTIIDGQQRSRGDQRMRGRGEMRMRGMGRGEYRGDMRGGFRGNDYGGPMRGGEFRGGPPRGMRGGHGHDMGGDPSQDGGNQPDGPMRYNE